MLRSGSSPPERDRALVIVRMRSQRQMPTTEQHWLECTQNALRMQEQRFEEVAASYMLETKQAFQTERTDWRQSLLVEAQQMSAHDRHEAQVEQHQVEHQMLDAFKRHASHESAQFQRAAQTEQQALADAANVDFEVSCRELILAQTRFHEASSQQTAHINSLRNALTHAEMRYTAVREDLRALRGERENYSNLLQRAESN